METSTAGEAAMQLVFNARNFPVTEELKNHTERRLQFALSRFGERVGRVTVYLWNRHGLQDGSDNGCRVEVAVNSVGVIAADDMDSDPYEAIERSAERVGRAVARALALLRERETLRPRKPSP